MSPKRGQPPKSPEEKKVVQKNIFFTEGQAVAIEAAKEIEAPDKKVSAYIRDVVVDHVEKVNSKKK